MAPATAARVRARALTVLSEVAADWCHVAAGVLLPALREDPALAAAAGGAVLSRIVDLPDVDVDLLAAIEPHLPPGRHVDFDPVARDITARLVAHRLPRCGDDAERARLHIGYGRRLANAGDRSGPGPPRRRSRRQAAWEALARAVTVAGAALAADPSPATTALLAEALHQRGYRLAALNRYPEALSSVERAVGLLVPLAEGDQAYRIRLAEAFDNLGTRLANVDRHREAQVAARRGVQLFTDNARSRAGEVGLAGALTNLAAIEAHLGHAGSALEAVCRAEQLWRRLSAERPSVYLPELALTLNTLGLRHAESDRLAKAVDATVESVTIYRELAEVNPPVFELDLAAVLANLSGYLWQLGRRTEALHANTEAERIFARWGGADPGAFSLHLRYVRENLARMIARQTPTDLRRWELGAGSFAS